MANENHADFTPTIPDSKITPEKAPYVPVGSFKFWAQKVLPTAYDDSLSYYEVLTKLVWHINKMIEDMDNFNQTIDSTLEAYNDTQDYVNNIKDTMIATYNQLQGYVNHYFDNLDVQNEINHKLDVMAVDGSLSNLIAPLVPSLVTKWLNENVTPVGSAVVVDESLTIRGAAADAKVTGNIKEGLRLANEKIALAIVLDGAIPVTLPSASAGVYNRNGNIQYEQHANLVHYNFNVEPGQIYSVKAYSQGDTLTPFCVFFDSNGGFISYVASGDNAVVTKKIDIPVGAAVMAVNHNTQTQTATCSRLTQTSTKEYVDSLAGQAIDDISYIAPKEYVTPVTIPSGEAGLLNLNGNLQYAQYPQFKHYLFDVEPLQAYQVTLKSQNNTSIPYGLIYDANRTIITRLFSENVGQTGAVETHVFRIPNGGARLVLNNDTSAVALSVYLGTYQSVEEYVADTVGSYWKGKKIVWFGTSIPAGVTAAGAANGSGSYPVRIGEMLGATMYNESVGSSQVRGGAYESITADDPMGYGGCSAVGLMYSLSLSSAEKQEIADNWDSKWKNIITWYGDQVNFDNLQYYKNSSWDIKLAKYLTGGSVGQCDLYVFDHGYNDSIKTLGYTDLSDVPSTANDRTYFLGAMRFLFEKILADNPKARILIIGHYCTDGRSGNFLTKYVTDAQTKLANIWQYPFIKTWEYMGFNHQPITVNGTTTTPAQSWMPDDVHPSSDTTGAALKHYAEVLCPLVNEVR